MDSCVPLIDSNSMHEDSQVLPLYKPLLCHPNISAKTSINKADSGLTTYNMSIPVSSPRKRSRDSFTNGFDSYSLPQNNLSGVSSDFDDDVFSQIQQQHDIYRFISDHVSSLIILLV